MSSVIKIKRSAVPGKDANTSVLELGELALNTYDGKMFFKKDDGTESIVTLLEVTEDNLAVDSSSLTNSSSSFLSGVLSDLDSTITAGGITYTISAETGTGGANLRLTDSGAGTDDVLIAGGTNVTVTRTDADTITISSTDTNTTYTGGTGLTLNGTTFDHTNSVTAGSASEGGSTRTLAYGGTFNVPSVTYDAQGHITATGSVTLTLPSADDTNTTYDLTVPTSTTAIRLAGSDTTNDDVTITGGTNVTVTRTSATELTIDSTDTNTTYTAGSGIDLNGTEFTVAGGVGLTAGTTGLSIANGGVGTTQLADDGVTYAKIQNVVGDNVFLGNDNGAGSAVQELTAAVARTILNVEDGATADQTKADIDALGIDADTLDTFEASQFLRSDVADTKTAGDLSFSDNVKATFGADSDLQIYHDGTNSRIYDVGQGDLRLQGTNIRILDSNGENYITAIADGAVTVYYDNAAKLATTATGVDVTGELTVDDVVVSGNLTVSGTTTTINTTNLDVDDAVITLNTGQATPLNDIGILMQRYATANTTNYNVGIAWEEGADRLIFGKTPEDGSDNDVSFSQEWMTIAADGETTLAGILNLNAYQIHTPARGQFNFTNDGVWNFRSNGAVKSFYLAADDLNAAALRNGTNAQTFNVYNTYTDASNYERGFIKWDSNFLQIGATGAGTGSDRSVSLMFGAAEKLRTTINSVTMVDAVPFSSGTYDLGTSSLKWGELHVNDTFVGDSKQTTETATLTTTTQTEVASFVAADYSSGKFVIQATDSVTSEVHVTELLVVHDGTTASATEYGTIHTGASPLATYEVDINTGNVRILATSASTNSTTYKVTENLITS